MTEQASYRISHRTEYQYSDPVAICQNQLRMTPRDIKRKYGSVNVHAVETLIEPLPDMISEHIDYFGNRVLSFSIESLHRQLSVSLQSRVTVHHARSLPEESAPWEQIVRGVRRRNNPDWLEVEEYCFDSPRIDRSNDYRNYALGTFTTGAGILQAGLELTRRIHREFEYNTTATDVETPADEAFRLRAGVCQDFAQVQIGCLRSIGLPARYVSGYLRTTPSEDAGRLIGSDESHAWVSLYCGQELGWIDLDPTNACVVASGHVPICVGRDYSDVTPMRGVVTGGGKTSLNVGVDVIPVVENEL